MFNGNGNDGMIMPVAPMYGGYGGNNGGFFGDGDFGGFILGLLFGGLGGWGGFGGFGGGWGGMMGWDAMFPYFFNTQTQNDVNRGFDNAVLSNQISALQGSIDSVRTDSKLSDIQNSINNGFASAEVANCGRAMDAMQTAYNNQIADLNRSFNFQTSVAQGQNDIQAQLAQCCCDNRLATESLRATVLAENCEDRNQALLNTRDIMQTINASVQSIKDQLCADKLEQKNDLIDQLRQELIFARGQASQIDQTAQIRASQATTANQLVSELRSCPIPAQPVYGNTPIFTCNGNGCGCNNGFFN